MRAQYFVPRMALWLLAMSWFSPCHAQFVQRLNAGPNATEGRLYGFSVASHGDWVAVGELFGLSGGSPAIAGGSVEVWRLHGAAMVREQRLVAPQPGGGHQFGQAIAMDGTRLAVVERGPLGEAGVVHVHDLQSGIWHLEVTLVPPAPPTGAEIVSVALHGDWLLAGLSTGWQAAVSAPGQVIAWQKDSANWVLRQVLHPLDSSTGDGFGIRVSAPSAGSSTPSRIAIGAPFRNGGRGAVYVFALTGQSWQQEQRLLIAPAIADEFFGFAAAINGDAVAGGTYPQSATPMPGRVGIWRRTGGGDFPWQVDAAFQGGDAQPGDRFGSALALPTPRDLVVGAPDFDVSQPIGPTLIDAGLASAYARRRSGTTCTAPWSLVGGVGNPAALPRAEAFYGFAIAADRLVAVSAPNGEVAGVGRAGFVDVSIHDRLLYAGLDCVQ